MYQSNLNIFKATFLSAEVQDDANENNYFARKVFRKKMKVLPGTVVTSSPPPIPVRPFQSQNSAALPAATGKSVSEALIITSVNYNTLTSLIKGHARLFFLRKKSSLPSDFHLID